MSTRGGSGDVIARGICGIGRIEIAARDKRAADVFWWTSMAMRAVIPLYVIYAIYLYWTLPIAVRYSGGGY